MLDWSSNDVVGKKVDAQIDLADLGLEVLTEMLTANVSELHHLRVQTNLRHGRLERLKVVAVEFASSDKRDADDRVARLERVDELATSVVVNLLVGRVLNVRGLRGDFCRHFRLVLCLGE